MAEDTPVNALFSCARTNTVAIDTLGKPVEELLFDRYIELLLGLEEHIDTRGIAFDLWTRIDNVLYRMTVDEDEQGPSFEGAVREALYFE